MKLHKHFKKYPFTLIPFALITIIILLIAFKEYFGESGFLFFGTCCVLLYITTVISFVIILTPGKQYFGEHTEEIGAILLAAVWPAIIIGLFAIGWSEFPRTFSANLQGDFTGLQSSLLTNAFYISTITFTSTGYGDFVPVGIIGRWYAVMESFLGHIHAAVFFAVVFSRIERWRNSRSKRIPKNMPWISYRAASRRTKRTPKLFISGKNKNRA